MNDDGVRVPRNSRHFRVLATCVAVAVTAAVVAAHQYQARSVSGTEVVIEIRTSLDKAGGGTDDLLTLIFSNVSAEQQRAPPRPLFGEDIVAEFSFSGRDARPGATLTFRRFVADPTFVNARYVRVVNHGADSWGGESISVTVGGRRVLARQTMYPRKGAQPAGGLEKFNPLQWYERVYWEADLQKIRSDRAFAK